MNNNTYDELAELGIFTSKTLSEEEYNKCIENNDNDSIVYLKGHYESGSDEYNKWFKEFDTKGLSTDEIRLQLEILQVRNLKSIKSMMIFFVVLTVVSIVIALLINLSLLQ